MDKIDIIINIPFTMCGRFVIFSEIHEVLRQFNARKHYEYLANYNAAPSQRLPVIVDDELIGMNWGLKPAWAKQAMINARAETLTEKSTFKNAKPCIVPANGFYEWKDKKPLFIQLKERKLFGMAGIYDENGFAIITTEPNGFMKSIHHRMPVIVEHGSEDRWMARDYSLLRPSREEMTAYNVSSRVNSPAFNNEKCLEKAQNSYIL